MPLLSSPFIIASELSPFAGDAVLRFRHQPTLKAAAASLAMINGLDSNGM